VALCERSILMEKHLIEAISEGVATLTLNRPERLNALSTPIMEGLLEALPRLAWDAAVGVVVLTGAGRAFCAGGDVKRMAEGSVERSMEDAVTHLRDRMEVSRLLHEMPKPTIAWAGSWRRHVVSACLRPAHCRSISALRHRFREYRIFRGLWRQLFSLQTCRHKARELYYTADPVDAAQALALGVVNRVVADADLVDATMLLARKLARGPRVALALMKQNFNAAENGTLAQLLDLEARRQIETSRTDDHREAARAFVEKRPPAFTGR
jgi:2-(1,2-epoxy-1,2-dihydrophenyl)acetyl-CoA isomerase